MRLDAAFSYTSSRGSQRPSNLATRRMRNCSIGEMRARDLGKPRAATLYAECLTGHTKVGG